MGHLVGGPSCTGKASLKLGEGSLKKPGFHVLWVNTQKWNSWIMAVLFEIFKKSPFSSMELAQFFKT